MDIAKKHLTNIPLIALLIANAIPIVGVLCFEWDAFAIVLLYWTENLVIGFYNVLKMALCKMPDPAGHISKFFMIPFFTIHYGGFTAAHGLFVITMFKKDVSPNMPGVGDAWPCFLVFLQLLFNVIGQIYSMISLEMKLTLGALFVSHGISFVYNYLLKGEYAKTKLDTLMIQPYGRIVVMHIAIIAGGFVTLSLGSPVALLLVLVVLKTIFDVKLHLRQHKKKR